MRPTLAAHLGLALLAALVSACGESPLPPLCRVGPELVPRGASMDSIELEVFERLLLVPRHAPTSGEATWCTGEPTRFPEVAEDCASRDVLGEELPAEALGPEDLVLTLADGDFWLAYLPVRRFTSGQTEGPVAIVVKHEGALEVRAFGILRTYASRLSLRVERVGTETVLVADGEHCDAEGACTRVTRLLALVDRRFVALHVEDEAGHCLGPATFSREETQVIRGGEHVERTLRRSIGLDVGPDQIDVAEQILVNERDPSDASRPARVVRRADTALVLELDLEHERFVLHGVSRWSSMLVDADPEAERHR